MEGLSGTAEKGMPERALRDLNKIIGLLIIILLIVGLLQIGTASTIATDTEEGYEKAKERGRIGLYVLISALVLYAIGYLVEWYLDERKESPGDENLEES